MKISTESIPQHIIGAMRIILISFLQLIAGDWVIHIIQMVINMSREKPINLTLFKMIFLGFILIRCYLQIKNNKTNKGIQIVKSVDSLVFNTSVKEIIVNNPFRGIFISGGAGSGKSKSLIEPIIQQSAQKNYCGILYDFKFPTLAEEVKGSFYQSNVKLEIVNFSDLSRTKRVNPISVDYVKNSIFARECALTILTNLDAKAVQRRDFWIQSAESLLTGTILYLRNNYPDYCTLPHVVSLILESGHKDLLTILQTDDEVSGTIASLRSAQGSENTIAGMFATVQNYLSTLNTREIFWVLSANEFSLKLNDVANPTFLVIGNDDAISKSLSPVIALVISQALKQMNQPNKQQSVIILDEAPTINIPNFSQIPATGRSNKIATVYAVQDIAQMEAEIGKQDSEKILANLACQFYGRTTNIATADRVSRLFGEYEKEVITTNKGKSLRGNEWFSIAEPTNSKGLSKSHQLRKSLPPEQLNQFEVGEFACVLAESNYTSIRTKFNQESAKAVSIEPFSYCSDQEVKANYSKIKIEAKRILNNEM